MTVRTWTIFEISLFDKVVWTKKERKMALSLQHTFVFSCLLDSFWALTVFTRSNAMATIYFIMQFCVASNRERRLLNSVLSAKSFVNATLLRKASFIKFNSSHMMGCDKHQFSDKMTVRTWTIFEILLFDKVVWTKKERKEKNGTFTTAHFRV